VKSEIDNQLEGVFEHMRAGLPTPWLRPSGPAQNVPGLAKSAIEEVRQRFERFERPLAQLFPDSGWDGRIRSPLQRYPARIGAVSELFVKCDSLLPMTGSVKARGGVYELLCSIEAFARREKLLTDGMEYSALLAPAAREALAKHRVIVASTGNLGFSIGLVGRAFGVDIEVHMSSDAKEWKKTRLRALGARVVEHATDYEGAVSAARQAALACDAYFIDDERSLHLFAGYSVAGRELATQLAAERIEISADRPLVVYLPCGVGGAPGGISAGLLQEYADAVVIVFVEPIASACMFVALATGQRQPVYAFGLDNNTIADGLAVPTASELVVERIGARIDAVIALPDSSMTEWVRRAWRESKLRLEPSGAAGFAAIEPFLAARAERGDAIGNAVHVVWTTGGSLVPDSEFESFL